MTEIVADFQVTRWDAEPYAEQDTVMSQVVVEKTFTGAISGTSTARVLTAQAKTGQGYVASERFEGTIDGRSGTLVYQHGGIMDDGDGSTFGTIVPGSGTGDLADLRGTVSFWHDEKGATVTLKLS
ncbi:DUF3224 domain-containing protein [Kineosporia babensis]|uniref:DUF3224 domain-containing protein n=1 Tax=Kineosporia babensis TaxID=499548 RepID=A0A9X1SUF3_9ACTN|nr:DUF3224 domain-containing protein [Kineosporia babensis]MCD5312371.1 DUF3224 domain-containing protein [Kineosporia babensis]